MRRFLASLPIALLFVAVASLACFRLIDGDLWLHIRTGELIWRTGSVPGTDFFSFSASGRPWVDVHWLSQAVLWIVYAGGGAVGLCILRLAVVLAIFLLLYRCCRLTAGVGTTVSVLSLALLTANDRFLMKPDLFALLLSVAFVTILERAPHGGGRRIWALVPLQAIWANAHPSFFLGPFLILIYWVDALISHAGGRGALRKPLALVFIAASSSCLANPYGIRLLSQPWEQVSAAGYTGRIVAWMPPSYAFPAPFSFFFFAFMLACCIAAIALNARRARPAHVLTLVAFALLALKSRRNLALFGLLNAPGLACNLACIGGTLRERQPRVAACIAVGGRALASAGLCALVWLVATDRYYIAERSLRQFGLGASEIAYPDSAIEFLTASGAKGNLFCNYDTGSYIAGRCSPRFRVFIDGRNLVYGEEIFREYLEAMGDGDAFDRLAAKYNIQTLLFTHNARDAKAILPHLWRSARWVPAYADDRAVVFLSGRAAAGQRRLGLDGCRLHGIPSSGRFPLAELRGAELFFTLGMDRCARELAQRALERYPAMPEAHNILGAVAMRGGDAPTARDEFETACRLSLSYVEPRINLAVALLREGNAEEAARHAKRACRLAPGNARAHGTLGLALLSAGRAREALAEFEEAVRLDPEDPEQHSNLGALHQRRGELDLAIAEYEKALSLSRTHFPSRFNIALIHAGRGDVERAIALYEEALAIDPGHAGARRNLAVLYAGRGEMEKAREQLREALRLEPGDLSAAAMLRKISPPGPNKNRRGAY